MIMARILHPGRQVGKLADLDFRQRVRGIVMMKLKTIAALAGVLALSATGVAHAGLIGEGTPCYLPTPVADSENFVFAADPVLDCKTGVGIVDSEAAVSALFSYLIPEGEDGFELIDKDEPSSPEMGVFFVTGDPNNDTLADIDFGATRSGFYFISKTFAAREGSFALVLKGGNGGDFEDETRWGAFLIDIGELLDGNTWGYDDYWYGGWESAQGLSHTSLYYVPEPGALALLGLGLAGLGLRYRRKTSG